MTALSAGKCNGIWLLPNAVVFSKSARKQSKSSFRKENYHMKKAQHIVLLALLLSIILTGCGKKEKHLFVATEATETETTASAAAERETLSELPYRPGRMGVYVMAAPDIEADSEVLEM